MALAAYLTRLYGPLTALSNVQVDVMTALVSFDRVFEVLDLPPMIDEQARRRGRSRRARPASSSTTSTSATRRPRRSRWPRSSRWPCSTSTVSQQVLFDVTFTAEPGQLVALVGPVGRGQDHHQPPGPAPLRRARRARSGSTGSTCATPPWPR